MTQVVNRESPLIGVSCPQPNIRQGILLLFQARCYAQELQRDAWEFAVELSRLLAAGPSINDCRWLVCKGYVEHASEITSVELFNRQFQLTPPLSFDDRTCFILTDLGEKLAAELPRHDEFLASDVYCRSAGADDVDSTDSHRAIQERADFSARISAWMDFDRAEPLIPSWDGERHQLRLGNLLVKEFKLHCPNQKTILMTFEEEKWPPRIDDPLSPHPELDPKRRLHDTIKTLNRNQKNRLIRFMGDGTGRAIRWELATQLPLHGTPARPSVSHRKAVGTII